jgi:signal transduction histidine kinase
MNPMYASALACALMFSVECSCIAQAQSASPQRARADSLQAQATRLYKFSPELARALALQLEALQLYRELGDSVQIAVSLQRLAQGFAAVSDTSSAKQYATEAYTLFAHQKAHRGFLSCVAFLAQLELAGRNPTAAAAFLRDAETYITRHAIRDSSLLPAALFIQRAELSFQLREYEQALAMSAAAERVFGLYQNNRGITAEMNGKCARSIFIARVYNAQARYGEALKVLASIRSDSAKAGRLRIALLFDWYQAAASTFAGARQYDSAYFYERAAHALADSLSNAAKLQTLANVQVRYDVERRNERLSVLERETALQNRARMYFVAGLVLLGSLLLVAGVAYRQKQRSERLLQERNVELDRLNIEKTEFLNIAAHDLKSPLAAIELSMRLAAQEPNVPPRLHEVIERTQQSAEAMMRLISRLLDLNAIESGLQIVRPSTFDAALLLTTLTEEWQEAAHSKNIRLTCAPVVASAQAASMLHTDRDLLRQALDNLFSNAVKFTPSGFQAGVEARSVTRAEGSFVQMVIWNEGVVIHPSEQDRLFGRFEQLSTKPTGGEHSSGLGLAIVKRVVTMLSGRVWYESSAAAEPPRTAFIVELPAAENTPIIQTLT